MLSSNFMVAEINN